MTLSTLEKKRLIIACQFGHYFELVKTLPYQELQANHIHITFNFKNIDTQVAFYMVVNGYLEAFSSSYQQETLLINANQYRQEHRVKVDDLDAFFDAIWTFYCQKMSEAETLSQKQGTIIQRHGSPKKLWNRLMEEQVPELETKRQAFLKAREVDETFKK